MHFDFPGLTSIPGAAYCRALQITVRKILHVLSQLPPPGLYGPFNQLIHQVTRKTIKTSLS